MTPDKPEHTLDQLVRARMMAFAIAGVFTVTVAIFVARYFEFGQNVGFDLQGDPVMGTAEPHGDGSYRLRYEANDGIHARTYRGGFGLQKTADHPFDVELVRDPDDAGKFQPLGLSYIPGALVLVIFCVGMAFMLHARRIVIMHRRNITKN